MSANERVCCRAEQRGERALRLPAGFRQTEGSERVGGKPEDKSLGLSCRVLGAAAAPGQESLLLSLAGKLSKRSVDERVLNVCCPRQSGVGLGKLLNDDARRHESLLSAAVFTGNFNAHEPVAEHGLEHNRVDSHFSVHTLRVGRQNIPCELGRTVADGCFLSAENSADARSGARKSRSSWPKARQNCSGEAQRGARYHDRSWTFVSLRHGSESCGLYVRASGRSSVCARCCCCCCSLERRRRGDTYCSDDGCTTSNTGYTHLLRNSL